MLTLLLTGCVTLGKYLCLSEPQGQLSSGGGHASLGGWCVGSVIKHGQSVWHSLHESLVSVFLAGYNLERCNHVSLTAECPKRHRLSTASDHLPRHQGPGRAPQTATDCHNEGCAFYQGLSHCVLSLSRALSLSPPCISDHLCCPFPVCSIMLHYVTILQSGYPFSCRWHLNWRSPPWAALNTSSTSVATCSGRAGGTGS